MGWNPFAAKSNNPLDNVELPADAAIPDAPEQPGGVKEVEKAAKQGQAGGAQNIAALSASFSDMGNSMAEFSNIVGDLKRSGQWNEAIKIMSQHEATQQEKFKAKSEEHKLQVEQLKAGALREQNQAELERRKHQHEMDMKKVQYQDQLAQKRKEREMQLELQKQKMAEEQRLSSLEKEEGIRRQTILWQQEEELKKEGQKAKIHARAMAEVERENHDLRMEQKRLEAKERGKADAEVGKESAKLRMELFKRLMQNQDGMLTNAAFSGAGLICAFFAFKNAFGFGFRHLEAITTKPNLVQETSRKAWNTVIPSLIKQARGQTVKRPNYIFSEKVQSKVEDIKLVTRNALINKQAHRNVLLYGPPGTGKTLYAKSLATDANMQYAIMSGGDVAPLGAQATYELNKLFNWADKSKKGLVLFIDEAEAFLRPRDENMSPELRSVINTFLARTGEPSNKMQIVLATNQVNQLDSAVLDRMNELLEIPLPEFPEREAMLKQYILSKVIEPASMKDQRVSLSEDVIPNFNDICSDLANITEGMSGREIEKMCSNVYASAVSKEEAKIDRAELETAAREYKSQSDEKARIREYQLKRAMTI